MFTKSAKSDNLETEKLTPFIISTSVETQNIQIYKHIIKNMSF